MPPPQTIAVRILIARRLWKRNAAIIYLGQRGLKTRARRSNIRGCADLANPGSVDRRCPRNEPTRFHASRIGRVTLLPLSPGLVAHQPDPIIRPIGRHLDEGQLAQLFVMADLI